MPGSETKLHRLNDEGPLPDLNAVGGKAYSLMRLSREGSSVPPGFVLPVAFFARWLAEVKAGEAWRAFVEASPDEMVGRAAALPASARNLTFDSEEAAIVTGALKQLDGFGLFAVRSSSPDEDLSGASFAGGYTTILGAKPETIEDAVRSAFVSCLEPRVFIYKRQRGFDVSDARIAVVVQAQIASEVAGVGFSVEPLSNDYDRAVFNANWGLGETVVSGLATPDQFETDKLSGEVVRATLGAKETSIWLLPDGGTEERPDPRHSLATLSNDQLARMTQELARIERVYGCPMDIEWAWKGADFYLLQARPITTYLPLPAEMVTAPGAPRRLYLDVTLAMQGIQEPLSVMGASFLETLISNFALRATGHKELIDPKHGLAFVAGGRLYLSLSHLLHLVSRHALADFLSKMDSVAADALNACPPDDYVSADCPAFIVHLPRELLTHVTGIPMKGIAAALRPEHSASTYHRKVEAALSKMEDDPRAPDGIGAYADWVCKTFVELMIGTLIPPLAAAIMARQRLGHLFAEAAKTDPRIDADLVHIDQALPHNITIDMGLSLYAIAEKLAPLGLRDVKEMSARLAAGELPDTVLEDWQSFVSRFGFRGPRELDIAAPRYRERPELLFEQILSLIALPTDGDNPETIHQQSVARRQRAHERLRKTAYERGVTIGKEYDLLYRAIEHFGGYRENHKYYMVKAMSFVRKRAEQAADALVAAGRLTRSEEVFDLTLDTLTQALEDPTLDLAELREQNQSFLRKLAQVHEFPHIVDSRGRIIRPPRPAPAAGELAGQPVSPGVARGPVKVLHAPDEKPIAPGDILVARATDPGWTPLFVSAAAIVLEVGGMLQHGSLVAREYGKPCVAGVQDATTRLSDGDLVEVDGSSGMLRFVEKQP